MLPEDIDSLFRNQLDGHQLPPGDDLWARLQAHTQLPAAPETDATPPAPAAGSNRLDELFRTRLSQHTTTPPRQLWERLEDEHLRPRKRRAAAWWPLAIAATVALFMLVGGGLLWQGMPGRHSGPESVAGVPNQNSAPIASRPATNPAMADAATAPAKTPVTMLATAGVKKVEKNSTAQATGTGQLSSRAPEGQVTAPRRPATRFGQSARTAPTTYATLTSKRVQQPGPAAPSRTATTDHLLATGAKQVAPVPDAAAVAQVTPAPAPASSEVIEVEVRRGGGTPALAAAPAPTAAADDDAPEASRRLGRLFQRANGAVRFAKNGLAAAQNLPDNLTVQARVGQHTLSKTIEL